MKQICAAALFSKGSLKLCTYSTDGFLESEKEFITADTEKAFRENAQDFFNPTVTGGKITKAFAVFEKLPQPSDELIKKLFFASGLSFEIIRLSGAKALCSAGESFRAWLELGQTPAAALIFSSRLHPRFEESDPVLHICIEAQGKPCTCGGRGCLTTLISDSGIIETALKKLAKNGGESCLKDAVNDELVKITVENICDAAAQGDKVCLETIEETASFLCAAAEILVQTAGISELQIAGRGRLAQLLCAAAKTGVKLTSLPMMNTETAAARLAGLFLKEDL